MEFQIYDGGGKLLLDGKLERDEDDRYAIYDGYECSETYDGYYKEGKYSGKGILYSYEQEKLKEGIWEEGELFKGVEYNCLYQRQSDGSLEFQESYRGYIDGELVERRNIRTLKAFFKQLRSE